MKSHAGFLISNEEDMHCVHVTGWLPECPGQSQVQMAHLVP